MITEIKKGGYVFSVDIEKTREYYKSNSICNCEYCQNFYKQIDGRFPELEEFLAEFGVDISRPDENMSFDTDNSIEYSLYYTVTGKIDKMHKHEIECGDLDVFFHQSGSPWVDIPNEQTEPYFIIGVSIFTLPWVLDTPYPSPYIRKNIFTRLFNRFKKK